MSWKKTFPGVSWGWLRGTQPGTEAVRTVTVHHSTSPLLQALCLLMLSGGAGLIPGNKGDV